MNSQKMNPTFDVDLRHKEWSLDTNSLYMSRGGSLLHPMNRTEVRRGGGPVPFQSSSTASAPSTVPHAQVPPSVPSALAVSFPVPTALPVGMNQLKLEMIRSDTAVSEKKHEQAVTRFRISLRSLCVSYASISLLTLLGYTITMNHGTLGIHCVILFMTPVLVVTTGLHVIACFLNGCRVQGSVGSVFLLGVLPVTLITRTWMEVQQSLMPSSENMPGKIADITLLVIAFISGSGFLSLGALGFELTESARVKTDSSFRLKWRILTTVLCLVLPTFTLFEKHQKQPGYDEAMFVMSCLSMLFLSTLSVLPLIDTSIEMMHANDATGT